MIVMKFGGSSLGSAAKILHCADLVAAAAHRRPVVVVSACGKTTNGLDELAQSAVLGDASTDIVAQFHRDLAAELEVETEQVDPLLDELAALIRGVHLLGELTERTRDRILSFGERMSARLFSATLTRKGIPAQACDAFDLGLRTDGQHGNASPLAGIEEDIKEALSSDKFLPVVTGFLGRSPEGHITTLGRSGSDYSASIVGAAIDAEEVQIWTDVDGVMTCDPSVDRRAQSLPVLSFEEASELAYYGAEVLHPSTIVPAVRKGIPVWVKNTAKPEEEGTCIDGAARVTNRIAKSVVYKEDVCLITISTTRLMSAVRVLSSAFTFLDAQGIGIHLATTSEATVSMVTDRPYDQKQLDAAREALSALGDVVIEQERAVVCVVGEELRGQVGVLGRIFDAIAVRGIKARMVSQSASEINVALLVGNDQVEKAVIALHDLLLAGADRQSEADAEMPIRR